MLLQQGKRLDIFQDKLINIWKKTTFVNNVMDGWMDSDLGHLTQAISCGN